MRTGDRHDGGPFWRLARSAAYFIWSIGRPLGRVRATKSAWLTQTMSTETISITVDSDAAQSFSTASPEERRKLELLLRLRLRELTTGRARNLQEIMDDIGARAEAAGMTPEKLESMLGDE